MLVRGQGFLKAYKTAVILRSMNPIAEMVKIVSAKLHGAIMAGLMQLYLQE